MTTEFAINDVCCVALELSKSTWVCAFAPPESGRASVHRMRAGDVDRLISVLEAGRARAMGDGSRALEIVLCYEVGYDGFWLARLLIARGIRTIVFDPASFLKPRRGRPAKTDRLDAEEMTRILRTWLSGDRAVATAVRIPTVEEEDAKRIERERKNLVEERTRIVGRIKGLLALHGIWLSSKRIGKRLLGRLDTMTTGDGRPLPPFLRRDIVRMIRHYEFICDQIAEVEVGVLAMSAATMDRALAPAREKSGTLRRSRSAALPSVRRAIPVRTFIDWDDPAPGFVEADLVVHSGPSTRGSYVQTLVLTPLTPSERQRASH